jgi:hypothetical protein
MAETYTTLDRVKLYLFNDISNTEYNFLLLNLINEVSSWMQGEMGGRRVLDTGSDETEIYDGDYDNTGRSKIFLKSWPLISVTSVEEKTGSLSSPTWVTIDRDNYEIDEDSGIIHFDFYTPFGSFRPSLPRGRRNLRVTYRGGYTATPEDLASCANKMIAKEFDKRNSQGITQESIGGGTVTWNELIDPSAERIFKKYRRF